MNNNMNYRLAYIRLFLAVICLFCSIKIQYSLRELFVLFISLLTVIISIKSQNYNELIYTFLLFPIVPLLGSKTTFKIDLYFRTIATLIVTIFLRKLSTNNILDTVNGEIRPSLGFTNPNTLSEIALVMILEVYILRKELNRNLSVLIIFGSLLLIYISKSRTTFLLLIFFFIINFILKKMETNIVAKRLMITVPVLCCLISYVFVYLYSYRFNTFLEKVNYILSNRLKIVSNYYLNYGISFFGQKVFSNQIFGAQSIGSLDNGYMSLLIRFGIIVTVVFLVLLSLTIKKLLDAKKYEYASCFVLFTLLGLTEFTFYVVVINIFLLLFAYVYNPKLSYSRKI
ncbi:hypothetical protein [Limosilactobacillus caviae]|nr:hypothetical protein [Limosilactobacillus caviae]